MPSPFTELERRRASITTKTPEDDSTVCPAYGNCENWKPYKLTNSQGEEVLDGNGDVSYSGYFICASVLENTSETDGVGKFNRKLLAKVPLQQREELRNVKNPSPDEWHIQDFFQGYDIFVVNFALADMGIPFIKLEFLEFTLILFGNIQPAVDPDGDFPNEAYRLAVCEAALENDRLYVYMEIEAALTVADLITFDGRLTIANVPVTAASELELPANANKWILSAYANLFVLGMSVIVTADAEWVYVDEENTNRRLQEDVCADVNRRRMQESEDWRRSLQESVPISDAPISYSVTLSCDSVLDCLEDIGNYIVGKLKDFLNLLLRGLEKLGEIAVEAFNTFVGFLDDALNYLGLKFTEAAEEIWEAAGEAWDNAVQAFDDAVSDGFQFKDLVTVGLAFLRGVGEVALSVINGVFGILGIGFGVERSKPRIAVGTTAFGCTKWQNRVETCKFHRNLSVHMCY